MTTVSKGVSVPHVPLDCRTKDLVDEMLEHRSRCCGDNYLITVRNIVRAVLRATLNIRHGNNVGGCGLDYRGSHYALHHYVVMVLEERGAQLWSAGSGGLAGRVYQVARKREAEK